MADRPTGRHAEAHRVADRLNGLLHRTITQRRLVTTQAWSSADGSARVQMTFRQGGPVLAPLRSRFGQLGLYVGQILQTQPRDEGAALVIVKYRYALHMGLDVESEPTVRWEFDGHPVESEARWSRRHVQGPIPLSFGLATVSLNALHRRHEPGLRLTGDRYGAPPGTDPDPPA